MRQQCLSTIHDIIKPTTGTSIKLAESNKAQFKIHAISGLYFKIHQIKQLQLILLAMAQMKYNPCSAIIQKWTFTEQLPVDRQLLFGALLHKLIEPKSTPQDVSVIYNRALESCHRTQSMTYPHGHGQGQSTPSTIHPGDSPNGDAALVIICFRYPQTQPRSIRLLNAHFCQNLLISCIGRGSEPHLVSQSLFTFINIFLQHFQKA